MSLVVPPMIGDTVPIPAGSDSLAGVGLRPAHYRDAFDEPGAIGWIEVHPENYLSAGGPAHRHLTRMREQMPLSFHGVGLSLGGSVRPDAEHLRRLKALCDRYQPIRFSEHLAWSSHGGQFLNDLLPVPYTLSYLARMIAHVTETQEYLGRRILIENPSLYLTFADNELSEAEFLGELARASGCGLLLDINNLYVSAVNLGRDPNHLLLAFPWSRVEQIHLAGHKREHDADGGTVLIDTHDAPVDQAVWQLYRKAIQRTGPVPTLIEWDNDMPSWRDLVAEAARARTILKAEFNYVAIA